MRRIVLLGLALPLLFAAVVGAQVPSVDLEPPPGALVDSGPVQLGLRVGEAVAGVRIAVDGAELPVSLEGGAARAAAELDEGSHVVDARVVDATGEERRRLWRFEATPLPARRLAGADRIATAIALSGDVYADGQASAAVLARGDDFADALAGVPLAVSVGGPLLLTGPGGLDERVAAELARLLGDGAPVLLLGGEQALGTEVAAGAEALGLSPRRLAGGDRYQTAALVAAELPSTTAVLASGTAFPDALAASVPAAVAGWPVLLTEAAALPAATAAGLERGGYERVVLVGGAQAAGPQVEDGVRALAEVERVAGATRYDTAAEVGRRFADLVDPSSGVALSSGQDFPDALAGAAHAAARRIPMVLADVTLPPPTAAFLVDGAPRELIAYGGPVAVLDDVFYAARAATVDGGGPATVDPPVGAQLAELGPGTVLSVATDLPAVDPGQSAAILTVDGRELETALSADGGTLRVEVTGLPATAGAVRLVAAARGPELEPVRHVVATWSLPALERTEEGFDRVGGEGPVAGAEGPLRTYSLEVEPGLGVDPVAFAAEAEAALSDARGWTGRGERRLQRVNNDPDIRVVVASPDTVDAYCARAGLDTAGRLSCWNGRFAMLNVDRWLTGADAFDAPLDQYRAYLVNHELGHGLGYGHRDCPSAGALAPVMMQQTKSTGSCLPNPWPYP